MGEEQEHRRQEENVWLTCRFATVITKNAQTDVPFPHVIEESSRVVPSHVPNREVVICGTHMKSGFFV